MHTAMCKPSSCTEPHSGAPNWAEVGGHHQLQVHLHDGSFSKHAKNSGFGGMTTPDCTFAKSSEADVGSNTPESLLQVMQLLSKPEVKSKGMANTKRYSSSRQAHL